MTVYELIQELVEYPPETEIRFEIDNTTRYYCNFKYKKILNELQLELN